MLTTPKVEIKTYNWTFWRKPTSSLLKRGLLSIISTTIGTNYRKKGNNLPVHAHNFISGGWGAQMLNRYLLYVVISLLQTVSEENIPHPAFFQLLQDSLQGKRKDDVLWRWFIKHWCLCDNSSNKRLTCLLDRSARSILFRTKRWGLTSRDSWNTGFLPEKGMSTMLKKKQAFQILPLVKRYEMLHTLNWCNYITILNSQM